MTEVNVNLVLNKYSSNFHIYQGICPKNKFFVNYHKILCKHNYVNVTNGVKKEHRYLSQKPTSGTSDTARALHLPVPLPLSRELPSDDEQGQEKEQRNRFC